MAMHKKLATGALASLAVAGLALGAAAPAQAEPNPIGYRTYSAVGSDTTQSALNAISFVLTDVASYDATPPAGQTDVIKTRAVGPDIPRPNGSTQGRNALKAATGNTTFSITVNGVTRTSSGPLSRSDVAFARSSSKGTFVSGGKYSFVPFAVDGVSFATKGTSTLPKDIPLTAPAGQLSLTAIYDCQSPLTHGGKTYTVGTGTGANVITPLVPQEGSGTREFFGETVGKNFKKDVALPSCVKDVNGAGASVQEHDGAALTRNSDIAPYSIAQYRSQVNADSINLAYPGLNLVNRSNGVKLGKINGKAPQVGTNQTLNPAFPVLRTVYNVVEYDRVTPGNANYDATLADRLTGTSNSLHTAKRAGTALLTLEELGFGSLPKFPALGVTAGDKEKYRADL